MPSSVWEVDGHDPVRVRDGPRREQHELRHCQRAGRGASILARPRHLTFRLNDLGSFSRLRMG
jgi:hypothetical protein